MQLRWLIGTACHLTNPDKKERIIIMGVLTAGWHRRHTRHRRRRPLPPSPTTPSRRSTAPSPSPPDRTLRPSSSQEPGGNMSTVSRITDQFCYLLLHPTNILLIYPQHIPQMLPKQFISGQGEQTGRPAQLPKPHLVLSPILNQIFNCNSSRLDSNLKLYSPPTLNQITCYHFRKRWSALFLI